MFSNSHSLVKCYHDLYASFENLPRKPLNCGDNWPLDSSPMYVQVVFYIVLPFSKCNFDENYFRLYVNCFYAPGLNDGGILFFTSLSSTLTFAITVEP